LFETLSSTHCWMRPWLESIYCVRLSQNSTADAILLKAGCDYFIYPFYYNLYSVSCFRKRLNEVKLSTISQNLIPRIRRISIRFYRVPHLILSQHLLFCFITHIPVYFHTLTSVPRLPNYYIQDCGCYTKCPTSTQVHGQNFKLPCYSDTCPTSQYGIRQV
jgi:hypothetical protein